MDEEAIYEFLDRMVKRPVPKAEVEIGDWNKNEVLKALLTAGLISENGDNLEITGKGRFFWKRVRRKRQGFV